MMTSPFSIPPHARRIEPGRRKPDGSLDDNDRVEIGPTPLAFAEWADLGLQAPHLPGMREKAIAVEGQRHSACMPSQKSDTQLFLKLLDRRCHRRLRNVEFDGGLRNPSGFGCHGEIAHLAKGQSHRKYRYLSLDINTLHRPPVSTGWTR